MGLLGLPPGQVCYLLQQLHLQVHTAAIEEQPFPTAKAHHRQVGSLPCAASSSMTKYACPSGGPPMPANDTDKLISLAIDRPIWHQFFSVFPLVIVGSKEDNRYNLAPKHLAMPLGWENHYCFVCSPRHTTYDNIRRHGIFTVSHPRSTEVLLASLAAAPRSEDRSKPSLLVLPTFAARQVDGVLV
jgi:hypothetical protein